VSDVRDKELVAPAVSCRQRRAHSEERRMLLRRLGHLFADPAVETLGPLHDFPGRRFVDPDVPFAVAKHELRERRDRQPARDLRTVGAHAVGDNHAEGPLVEPVRHGARRKARGDGLLIAPELDNQEMIVGRRSTETTMSNRAEFRFH
jgi:hypothetical protein